MIPIHKGYTTVGQLPANTRKGMAIGACLEKKSEEPVVFSKYHLCDTPYFLFYTHNAIEVGFCYKFLRITA